MGKLFFVSSLVMILLLRQGGFCPTEAWSISTDRCVGACCYPDGTCADSLTQAECEAQGGMYMGDGTDCAHVDCVPAIPTLTEWGLILFGLVLLGFITYAFFKRKKAFNP